MFFSAKWVHTTRQLAAAITAWLQDTDTSTTAGSIGKQLIEGTLEL